MKTIRVGATEYAANWDGKEITLTSSVTGQVVRSDPRLFLVISDGVFHVDVGDNQVIWPFDSEEEAQEFICMMQPILDAQLAAAREAGRCEQRGNESIDHVRCPEIDSCGYSCFKPAGHHDEHQRGAYVDGILIPVNDRGEVT